jgi:hypothetical protein
VKFYGPKEFFMTVLTIDMEAPTYGKHRLANFFLENIVDKQDRTKEREIQPPERKKRT